MPTDLTIFQRLSNLSNLAILSPMFSFIKNLFQVQSVQSKVLPPEAKGLVLDDLKTQIQKLIAGGAIQEALDLMIEQGIQVAVLLKAQWESGHKAYELKRLGFAEWAQVQNRINFAILAYFSPNETPQNPDAGDKDVRLIPDVPITEAQRTAVAQLVAQHHTQEALAVCKNWGVNFMLTEKRYTTANRHFHLGLILEQEWARVQKQVDEALLHFLEEHPTQGGT
jgi:hypothetical protein